MALSKTKAGIYVKPYIYDGWSGLDTSRDESAQETGERQSLVTLNNGHADWTGAIFRDPGATKRGGENKLITHINFFGRDLSAWAQEDGGGVTLKSESGHEALEVYPQNAVVSSTVFNGVLTFASKDQSLYTYDGIKFTEVPNTKDNLGPAYITTIQRRLAVAGGLNRTVVDLSRVDRNGVFSKDEPEEEGSVLKAADIDIRNFIGTSDEIKGLGAFETNRLAVFTRDKTLIYRIDPDFTQWTIEDKSNIQVGTISHNSIVSAGSDILFASREGVHSIRRSDANGLTIYSVPMSNKVKELYRRLVKSVTDLETISGWYDQDNGQYHLHFPRTSVLCTRLTLTLNPVPGQTSTWSTSTFLNARCGRQLGETTIIGTSGGIYEVGRLEDLDSEIYPDTEIETPIFWHGDIVSEKETHSVTIHASGKGTLTIRAISDEGRELQAFTLEIDSQAEDDNFTGIALSQQYERPFQHKYRGVRFNITMAGSGLVRLIGIAVSVKATDRKSM